MKKYSMKITESEFEEFLNFDYMLEYGYFSFNMNKINLSREKYEERNNLEEINETEIYSIAVSDMFSCNLWSMKEVLEFYKKNKNEYEGKGKDDRTTTIPIEVSGRKSNYTKRKYKFVNIYNYILLVNHLIKNKSDIKKLFIDDTNSTSKFFLSSFISNEIRKKKDIETKDKKFILKLDLSNFYPSIYTHTIPWVGMGKKEAKKNRREGMYNTLDQIIQRSQDGETKGIPIGSFSSKLIAEFYQLKIDKEIKNKLEDTEIHFHRYVDDYEFYYNSHSDKEKILTVVHEIYSNYELYVNDTKVIETEFQSKNSKSIEIRSYFHKYYGYIDSIINDERLKDKDKSNRIVKIIYDFIDYFSAMKNEYDIKMPPYFAIESFLCVIKEKNEGVYNELLKKNFLFELMGLFIIDMKYLKFFVIFIENNFEQSKDVVKKTFENYSKILNAKVQYYFNHDFQVEVSHILTLQLLFPYFEIDADTLTKIIEKNDSFTAIMAFHILYDKNKKDAVEKAVSRIKSQDEKFTFKNENFLFEYEIGLLCKHDEEFKDNMDEKIYEEFVKNTTVTNSMSKIQKFYIQMIQENIRIFKIGNTF